MTTIAVARFGLVAQGWQSAQSGAILNLWTGESPCAVGQKSGEKGLQKPRLAQFHLVNRRRDAIIEDSSQ